MKLVHFELGMLRLHRSHLTVGQAMRLEDKDLLRMPFVGRRTLNVVRAYQGPFQPLSPKERHLLNKPQPRQFEDEDGYTDWEDYDQALSRWEDSDPERYEGPSLREHWCGQSCKPQQTDEEFTNWLLAQLAAA